MYLSLKRRVSMFQVKSTQFLLDGSGSIKVEMEYEQKNTGLLENWNSMNLKQHKQQHTKV